MVKRTKPRAGSLAFKPRKRAKKETCRVRHWPQSEEVKPLGFCGYKAGMTHLLLKDNRKFSKTSGLEVFTPATILETPPLFVFGVRAYYNGYHGKETLTDVFTSNLNEDLKRRVKLPKKEYDTKKNLSEIEKNFEKIHDISLIIHTQPRLTSLPKKAPDIMEIALGGNNIKEKFNFAKEKLGKELSINEVFNENSFVDVHAVTKGKGFQGVVKRHGTIIQSRKYEKGRRHVGTGGAWTPHRKVWKHPSPGQLGYHTRTEHNKLLLKIGNKGEEVNPKGGFLRYGLIKKNYAILKGSLPGPTKRLIRLSMPIRLPEKKANFDITFISLESKQG